MELKDTGFNSRLFVILCVLSEVTLFQEAEKYERCKLLTIKTSLCHFVGTQFFWK